jgi:hypothetical protein
MYMPPSRTPLIGPLSKILYTAYRIVSLPRLMLLIRILAKIAPPSRLALLKRPKKIQKTQKSAE